jgi:hypothetical protein
VIVDAIEPTKEVNHMAAKKTFRPEALAEELGISGKVLRAWLRANHARPTSQKRTSWEISEAVAKEARTHFAKRTAKATPAKAEETKPVTRKRAGGPRPKRTAKVVA